MHGVQNLLEDIALDLVLQALYSLLYTVLACLHILQNVDCTYSKMLTRQDMQACLTGCDPNTVLQLHVLNQQI